jgi:hypothetical protein
MRIWDVNPGYLNRQSLLGEHRELHGLYNIIKDGKKGYSRHPETLRWYGKLGLLRRRHELLVSEMTLRGYNHRSPLPPIQVEDETGDSQQVQDSYVDPVYRQFELLKEKYTGRESGRIPFPVNSQQLWAQHKYSVLARDPEYYKSIGPELASGDNPGLSRDNAQELVEMLYRVPPKGRLINALLHMWGYVSRYASSPPPNPESDLHGLVDSLRRLVMEHEVQYLVHSTALSDLMIFCRVDRDV